MVTNERQYLQKLASSNPEDLLKGVRNADAQEERILRIYLGNEAFEDISHVAGAAAPTRGASATLGNVVVLHGIMGGELTQFDKGSSSLIWVQMIRLVFGRFDQLPLNSNGTSAFDVRPSGIYLRFYGSQLVHLSQEWNVRPFFYDWRRDIRFAADALLQLINSSFGTEAPVHLVAHSMGGLVARSYIQKYPDRWNKTDASGNRARLVMLGTPNFGSFAIPRMLLGTNDVLKLVARCDPHHNVNDLLNIAKTFVGAYQMMPVRGKLTGLDLLYKAETYSTVPIDQSHLDQAVDFQNEIAPVVDPSRMVYVAGYNRPTPADIKDPTNLKDDTGYYLSLKGDGTVPHNLGLLPGVPTFYVDEEHQNLPGNSRVLSTMSDLLKTGTIPNEQFLFRGLGPAFDNQRGPASEDQTPLLVREAARHFAKEDQAAALGALLSTRGEAAQDTVTPEEFLLADTLLRFDPPPMATGAPAAPPVGAAAVPLASPPNGTTASMVDDFAPPRTTIRVHIFESRIESMPLVYDPTVPVVDCMAVGHYLRVKPTGAELDLDRAISQNIEPTVVAGAAPAPVPNPVDDFGETLLLTQLHERGILRGDLGVPFFLPDPRSTHPANLLVITGMGQPGGFGLPELTFLVRDLTWSLGQIGKKHLATVLIGVGKKTLSVPDAIHAWMLGLNRAIVSCPECALQDLTFIVLPPTPTTANIPQSQTPYATSSTFTPDAGNSSLVASALTKEADTLKLPPFNFDLQLIKMPPISSSISAPAHGASPTRISIEFDEGTCRYSAMTDGASVAERVYRINPKRVIDINARLLSTNDPLQQRRLGQFLLDYLFPIDLRQSLTGSAPIILTCNNQAAQVYWELAAQPLGFDDSGAPGVEPYLGLTRGLTRQLKTVLAPASDANTTPGRVIRILVVADTCKEFPLPGARQEAELLLALFDRVTKNPTPNRVDVTSLIGPSKATTLDVLLGINSYPPFDILHYAGHCAYDAEHPDNSGLLFSGGDRLTANDLNRIDRTPKLVFANACESGVLPSRRDLASPAMPVAFAESFFQKGVANFICTAWPIGDIPARDFATEFYRHFLGDGVPPTFMFEAIRKARQLIAGSQTWGAYQHYGSPSSRAFRTR